MDVDSALIDEDIPAPHRVEQLGAGEDAAGRRHEEFKQAELGRPEVKLAALAADTVGVTVELETGAGAHDFATEAYPHWVPELDRAVELGTAVAARDGSGHTIGFACHSVNRAGWIGPMATDPTLQHGGVGSAVLAGLCADLDERGITTGEISWVSNLRFYGKCGARVSRVFLGGRRSLNRKQTGSG